MAPTQTRWASVVLLTWVHCTLAATKYGTYNNNQPQNINSPQIAVRVQVYGSSDGKCQYNVVGRGVVDNFEEDCAPVINDYTQINIDNYYTYFYPQYSPLGLYTDTPGTLVIIKSTGCTLRKYNTNSEKVTYTESALSIAVCDKIKKRIDDQMVILNDYWAKWEVNFKTKRPVYTLVDPLKDLPQTASLYDGQPGVPVTTSSSGYTASSQSLSPQPLTPPAQSSHQAQPTQPITLPTQNGGPKILGVSSIESKHGDSINGPSFNTYSGENHINNQCILDKCVKGNGVHDCFTMPCPENPPTSMMFKGLVIWGHPDLHPFSFFSEDRSTLYLFEGGWCTKKTYTTSGRVTSSKAEVLSPKDCVKAKKKLANGLKRRGMTMDSNGVFSFGNSAPVDSSDEEISPPPNKGNSGAPSPQIQTPSINPNAVTQHPNGNIIKVSTIFPKTSNGQCQVEISVVGKGVQDKFTEPCSDKPADIVSTDNVFVLGDPKINSLSLYSNGPKVLYVIKNKICTKYTYTTNEGVTKGVRTPLTLGACNQFKKTISTLITSHKSKPTYSSLALTPSSIQSTTSAATTVVSTSPAALQQFKPTYPFKLGNDGINSGYAMTVNMNINSYNVPGCNYYIIAKGRGVNDHFQQPCSNERTNALSETDFMSFGSPTSTLGLFSDTPSTLIMMTKGTCYKKTYGVTPAGPTLMGGKECVEVKKRMSSRISSGGVTMNGGTIISGDNNQVTDTNVDSSVNHQRPTYSQPGVYTGNGNTIIIGNNHHVIDTTDESPSTTYRPNTQINNYQSAPSPIFGQTFNPFGSTGQFNPLANQPSLAIPSPGVTNLNPTLGFSFGNNPGVTWRNGDYNNIHSGSPSVTIGKNDNGPQGCAMTVTIMGRGINDEVTESCSEMGTNIVWRVTSSGLAVGDPSSSYGMYTDGWGSLIIFRNGQCVKRKYKSSATDNNTKVTTLPVERMKCDKTKRKISGMLGANV